MIVPIYSDDYSLFFTLKITYKIMNQNISKYKAVNEYDLK